MTRKEKIEKLEKQLKLRSNNIKKAFIITFKFNKGKKIFFTRKSFFSKEEAKEWFLDNYKDIAVLIKVENF